MFDLAVFQSRIESFSKEYGKDFSNFWKWKVTVEAQKGSTILDARYRTETYYRLSSILPRWQTYRPKDNTPCLEVLRTSLGTIAEAYAQLRNYSLLDFEQVPRQIIALIWQELGKAKEAKGQTNDFGSYNVIAVCKPLLFLWGQTLAFDSKVRKSLPRNYPINRYSWNWTLDEWMRVMTSLSRDLKRDTNTIDFIKQKSAEWYGKEAPVPYGRLLDIYYFEGS